VNLLQIDSVQMTNVKHIRYVACRFGRSGDT